MLDCWAWRCLFGFMRSKISRRNKKKSSSNNSLPILAIFVIFGFLFYLLISNKVINFTYSTQPSEKLVSSKSLGNVLLTPPPPTPTPTSVPTPTPIPLVGFCLKVPVLMYHHVQPQDQAVEKNQTATSVDNGMFDQQVQYLTSQGYTFLTAKELVNALIAKSQLPAKSIVITLDDGYRDNYQYAYPVFKKYNVKGNFMIATGLLGGADYMSWDNIREMAGSGIAYFSDHTWSHYAVGYGTADKIRYEIATAKQQLTENTGQAVDTFTYPYGSFSDLSIDILKQEGFMGAFSTDFGDWQCDSFVMALHRRRIGNSHLSYYGL